MMTQWYTKEFSTVSNVSIRTLYYYDRINLLKPSIRLENGYRVYSRSDLSRLQQITTLKCFGFSLAKIKDIMTNEIDLSVHLKVQKNLMQEKAIKLQESTHALDMVISTLERGSSNTDEILNLMREYRSASGPDPATFSFQHKSCRSSLI